MSDYLELVEKVISEVSDTNVGAIFGESRQIGNQVVIPVGKISYGWGGGGKGKSRKHEQEAKAAALAWASGSSLSAI